MLTAKLQLFKQVAKDPSISSTIADFLSANLMSTKHHNLSSRNQHEGEYCSFHIIRPFLDTYVNAGCMIYSDKLTTGDIWLKMFTW